jgi:hypothetical protein
MWIEKIELFFYFNNLFGFKFSSRLSNSIKVDLLVGVRVQVRVVIVVGWGGFLLMLETAVLQVVNGVEERVGVRVVHVGQVGIRAGEVVGMGVLAL